jgi:hypothetical protein
VSGQRKYDASVTGAPVKIRRTIPARTPSIEADVGVPALTGLIIGLLAAIVPALLLSLLLGHFLAAYLGYASVFSVLAILWRLGVIDRSLWATEDIESTTPAVPAGLEMPALPAPQTPVLLSPYAGRERLAAEKRQDEQSDFARFVEGCENDTTLRRWEPEIGRGQYQRYRDALIDSGWANWRTDNTRDGWELSAAPATVCEALDA